MHVWYKEKKYQVLHGYTFCVAENNLSPYLRLSGFFLTVSKVYQKGSFSGSEAATPHLHSTVESRPMTLPVLQYLLTTLMACRDLLESMIALSHDRWLSKMTPRQLSWWDDPTQIKSPLITRLTCISLNIFVFWIKCWLLLFQTKKFRST